MKHPELIPDIGPQMGAPGGENASSPAPHRSEIERTLRQNELWLAVQKEAFQAAMNGASLESSLGVLVRTVVDLVDHDCRCGFYIVSDEGRTLRHVVGMSDAYARCVNGLKISPESLACELAVAEGGPVITRDVLEEPSWKPWTWLAVEHGYRAHWAFPIETAAGVLVGLLAMYFPQPREPTPRVREFAAALAQAAAIIISRHQSEDALRQSQERQAFLLKLSDAIRSLADAWEIQAVAADLLGRHLHANQAHYGETTGDHVQIHHSYAHGLPPMTGSFRALDFGQGLVDGFRAGKTQVCFDVATDPAITDAERRVLADAHIGAYIAVPLVKEGEWVATLGVHSIQPKTWKPGEVELVQEVAERTWAAVARARAEAIVRESELKYRSLFESIDTGYCVIEVIFDPSGKPIDYFFQEINPAFVAQTGLADALGRSIRTLVPAPAHEDFWFETYGRIARTGKPERFEHRADAFDRWFNVYAFKIGAPEENRVAVLLDDIKPRKLLELRAAFLDDIARDLARLPSPEEIMQAIGPRVGEFLDVSGCMFCEVDEERNQVVMTYGWTANGVPALPRTFRLTDYFTEEFAHASRASEIFIVTNTSRDERTDGRNHARMKIGALVAFPFFWKDRWSGCFSVTNIASRQWRQDEIELLKDVSSQLFSRIERARAETALRESEERLRAVANIAPSLLWSSGPDGTTFWYNDRWKDYTGQTTVQGWDWTDAIHPEDRADSVCGYREAIQMGRPFQQETRIRNATGEYRWFLVRAEPLLEPGGGVVRMYAAATDIHDMKSAEARLQEADRRKNHFLATLSHELRNPLAAVHAGLQLLASPKGKPESKERALPAVIEQTAHMERLVDDLMDVTRIVQGRVTLRREPMVMQDALRRAIDMCRSQMEAGSFEIVVDLPSEPLHLVGDHVRLTQVFVNILGNALKYSEKTRRVEVTALLLDHEISVRIRDHGQGIPAELLPFVFDAFVQARPGLTLEAGMGMGLAVVRQLVRLHGGEVQAFSAGEDRGSEFVVRLPVA